PVKGFQRLPGGGCHAGNFPRKLHTALRHQCGDFFRVDRPVDHPDFLDQVRRANNKQAMKRTAMQPNLPISRRNFLGASLSACAGLAFAGATNQEDSRNKLAADRDKALVAITLDLEMSRNFPSWEDTHWDYEKGNLNEETKKYAVEACRRVKAHGGVLHCFAVGRVLEQENIDWLKGIAQAGHPVGNHTYDH